MKKIVFTGGGTVGHVTLNLLLIPKFIEDGWEVHYIGDKKGVEYQQIKQLGQPVVFHGIATGKLRRYFSLQNLVDVFKVGWGIVQSLLILARIRPQALFSKGGFVSVPPVIAASFLRFPVFIHESDLSMGLANRIAYKFATVMYTTFEQGSSLSKTKHVGAVTKVPSKEITASSVVEHIVSQFDGRVPTVLFVGGSAGAKVFNDFVSRYQQELTSRYNIINLTGDERLNQLSHRLYRTAYATDLYLPLMAVADMVVTRGGANTLFELVALQKPHLIVPLGREASRGDQLENACYFVEKGYAQQLLEEDLTIDCFMDKVDTVLAEKERYISQMAGSFDIQSLEGFYDMLQADIARKEHR